MKRLLHTIISLVILAAFVVETYRDQGAGFILGM